MILSAQQNGRYRYDRPHSMPGDSGSLDPGVYAGAEGRGAGMSEKSERLLDRICRMEDKLISLKCEYNMLLCKEDHDGDLSAFASSMDTHCTQKEDPIFNEGAQTIVLIPPHKRVQP